MTLIFLTFKPGLTISSLFRLEPGHKIINYGRLHEVLKRLRMTLGERRAAGISH
jgi:hypothetical protein